MATPICNGAVVSHEQSEQVASSVHCSWSFMKILYEAAIIHSLRAER